MRITAAAFVHGIAPYGGVDPTEKYVDDTHAEFELEGAFLRVKWKRGGTRFRLVPLANVREMQCAPDEQPKPAQAQPKAKAR